MSGYRCVSYLDLCRLCTSSNGNKIQIFSQEGKERHLYEKIEECLPIKVLEDDRLPKILCSSCVESVETITKFREKCLNSQTMLESCLNSGKLRDGGKVYIKDVGNRKSANTAAAAAQQQQQQDPLQSNEMLSIGSENTSASFTFNNNTTNNNINSSPQTTNIYATVPFTTQSTISSNNSKINGNNNNGQQTTNDYLSSIIQAVGIQNSDDSEDVPAQFQQPNLTTTTNQYTINLDDSLLQKNKFHYKIEHANNNLPEQDTEQQQFTTFSNIDEFLRLKPSVKKQTVMQKETPLVQTISLETNSNHQQQQPQQHFNIVIAPSRSSPNNNSTMITTNSNNINQKCFKFTNATGTTATTTTTTNQISLQDLKLYSPSNKCFLPVSIKEEPQYIAHIDTQNIVLPHGYVQMKLPSNITTIDGQQVLQLSPANFQNTYTIPSTTQIQTSHKLNNYQTQQILQTMVNTNNNNNNNNKTINSNNGNNVINKKKNVLPTKQMNKGALNTKGKLVNTGPVIPSFTISQVNDALTLNNNAQNIVTNVCPTTGQTNIQFATLQNVITTNVQQPIPKKSGITIKRMKTEATTTTTTTTTAPKIVTGNVNNQNPINKLTVVKNPAAILLNNQKTTKLLQPPLSQSTPKPTKKLLVQQIKDKTQLSMIGSTTITTTSASKINGMNTPPPTTTATITGKTTTFPSTMIKTSPKMNSNGSNTNNSNNSSNPEEKPKCVLCDKVFKRKEHLAQHAKLHLGLRPFKCEEGQCTKAFSRKEHLLRHIVSHTGKKMFNCDICFKLFSRKDNLNKHKRSHDVKTTDNKQALKLLLKTSPITITSPIE